MTANVNSEAVTCGYTARDSRRVRYGVGMTNRWYAYFESALEGPARM